MQMWCAFLGQRPQEAASAAAAVVVDAVEAVEAVVFVEAAVAVVFVEAAVAVVTYPNAVYFFDFLRRCRRSCCRSPSEQGTRRHLGIRTVASR